MACRGLLPRIGGHSSPLPCGLSPARALASSTCSPRPTIHRATTWWSACTGSSRMLRARGAGPAWHSHLPWVLLGLRATPKEDSAVSSAELVTGTPLVLPGQLLHVPDPPRVDMPPPPTRPLSYAAAANTPPSHLARAEHVYVRVGGQQKPLAAPYAGPYLVVSRVAKTFTIQVGQRQKIESVDRLKPHTGLGPVSRPTSRGRPPKLPAAPSIQPASS